MNANRRVSNLPACSASIKHHHERDDDVVGADGAAKTTGVTERVVRRRALAAAIKRFGRDWQVECELWP